MPVVINEFEVVAAPEAPRAQAAAAPEPPPAAGVTPQDVERIVTRTRERAARLRAH